MEPRANDSELTHNLNKIDRYHLTYQDELKLASEYYSNLTHVIRVKLVSKLSNKKIDGLLQPGAFKYLHQKKTFLPMLIF